MKRVASIYRIRQDKVKDYIDYHVEVWPEVLATIGTCNIRNNSIYHMDGYMFSYIEYIGDDYDADMAKMAVDPKTQEWWAIMNPMEERSEKTIRGEMEEVFHMD